MAFVHLVTCYSTSLPYWTTNILQAETIILPFAENLQLSLVHGRHWYILSKLERTIKWWTVVFFPELTESPKINLSIPSFYRWRRMILWDHQEFSVQTNEEHKPSDFRLLRYIFFSISQFLGWSYFLVWPLYSTLVTWPSPRYSFNSHRNNFP